MNTKRQSKPEDDTNRKLKDTHQNKISIRKTSFSLAVCDFFVSLQAKHGKKALCKKMQTRLEENVH